MTNEQDRQKARDLYNRRYTAIPPAFDEDDELAPSYRNSLGHIEDIAAAIATERERADRAEAALRKVKLNVEDRHSEHNLMPCPFCGRVKFEGCAADCPRVTMPEVWEEKA